MLEKGQSQNLNLNDYSLRDNSRIAVIGGGSAGRKCAWPFLEREIFSVRWRSSRERPVLLLFVPWVRFEC